MAADECSAEETECQGLYLALFFGVALCLFAVYALIAAAAGGISIMMLLECFDYTGNLASGTTTSHRNSVISVVAIAPATMPPPNASYLWCAEVHHR